MKLLKEIQGVSLLSVKSNLISLDLSNHQKLINMGLFLQELKHNFAEMDPTSQTSTVFLQFVETFDFGFVSKIWEMLTTNFKNSSCDIFSFIFHTFDD